ncbi:hypothetical protein ACN38_g10078 [Penicillium nordicum]|uniref:Uncharacterized protein n=1 Tax=Penicillium nordicum TaxID=229535 RepID=A0A0M9WBZ1_9EURO|nr:hypothetical protein ACN38_g10078 [Penicillium nordicum]
MADSEGPRDVPPPAPYQAQSAPRLSRRKGEKGYVMLLPIIPYPKVPSQFRLTSLSLHSHFILTLLLLHSHFTLTLLSLHSRFFLASSFFTLLCCSVAHRRVANVLIAKTAIKEGTCLSQAQGTLG